MPQICKAKMYDILLMHHLKFPDLNHDLGFIGSMFTSKPAWKDDKKNFELYNARDVDTTFQAYRQLKPMLQQAKLMDLYENVQVPLALICKQMSETGFKINPNRIGEVREKITEDIRREEQYLPEGLRTRMVKVGKRESAPPGTLGKSGKPVKYIIREVEEQECPWASPVRVGKWLHEELELEPIADLKTGKPSTGKIALDKHYNRTKNRAIKAVKNLKKMNSLLTLFCKEEMLKIGTVHTHFNVHGTSSGRLSSSDPNLQNITEAAKFIYVPRHEGWSLVEADFSQIENRLTAWFANDTDRLGRFLADPDYSEHKWAAAMIFDLDYNLIEKDNDKDAPYGRGKRINHGSGYGLGAKKLALMYDLEFKEVKAQQDKLKAAMPLTVAWQRRIGEQVKRDQLLVTPFLRKRWLYTSSSYTEGLSFLPQSTAADIMFRSMLALMYERISWPLERVQQVVQYVEPLPLPALLLVSVHDSLVIECPDALIPNVVGCLRRVMQQPWRELGGFNIPVEVKTGKSWGEMSKYKGPII